MTNCANLVLVVGRAGHSPGAQQREVKFETPRSLISRDATYKLKMFSLTLDATRFPKEKTTNGCPHLELGREGTTLIIVQYPPSDSILTLEACRQGRLPLNGHTQPL